MSYGSFSYGSASYGGGIKTIVEIARKTSFVFNLAVTTISRITFTPFDIKSYLSKGMKMVFDIIGLTGAPSKIKAIVKEIKTRFRVKMK